MRTIAFYDTKPFVREFTRAAPGAEGLRGVFQVVWLTGVTAAGARGQASMRSAVALARKNGWVKR